MVITGRPQEDVTLAGCRNGHVLKVWQLSSHLYEWGLILWRWWLAAWHVIRNEGEQVLSTMLHLTMFLYFYDAFCI